MSKFSFLNFQYGSSRKSSSPKKPGAQLSSFKERQRSSMSKASESSAIEEMKWAFDKFDSNKDGKISKEEYKYALKVLDKEIAEAEVAKAFKEIDSDGDGFIDFNEFMEMFKMGGKAKATDIESAFRVFDLDGDGKISAGELSQVLQKLGESCSIKACKKMVKGVDSDGDGYIDIDEFKKMMSTK